MAILERAQQLRERLAQYDDFKKATRSASKFTERSQDVHEIRARLASAVYRAAVLSSNAATLGAAELSPLRRMPSALKALEGLVVLMHKLDEAPASANEGNDYATFRRRFEKCAADATDAVTKALEAVRQAVPSVDEAFLKQVETVPSYEARVRDIRAKRDELLAGIDVIQADPTALQLFLDRRAALRTLTDTLSPADFPESVIAFFRSARRGAGANLDALTDEVREWLKQRDLLKKLRIFLAS
jgi:hypothetical protein